MFQDNFLVFGETEKEIQLFNEEGKKRGGTFDYWLQYLNTSNCLSVLLNVSVIRVGILVKCFKSMLPYSRAFGYYKHFVWGSIYISDMLRLPSHFP